MKNPLLILTNRLLLLWLFQSSRLVSSRSPLFRSPRSWVLPTFGRRSSTNHSRIYQKDSMLGSIPRGGDVVMESDDERYSRQIFTMGKRAHAFLRSATVYVDGPSDSGLVYECVKDLTLSGVGNIALWSSDDPREGNYYDHTMDDLGKAYKRGASAELGLKHDEVAPDQILEEYARRLNPSVRVSRSLRPKSVPKKDSRKGILLCVDRPYETQVALNKLAREQSLAFVAVETAGVYGRLFCDFGLEFDIYDADGETPLLTPLDTIAPSEEESDESRTFLLRSMDTEKHDVSAGDTIEFHLSTGDVMDVRCTVSKVMTPYRIKVKLEPNSSISPKGFLDMVKNKAASFSRVKIPQRISFWSLEDAMKAPSNEFAALFTPCDLDKSFDDVRRSAVLSCFQGLSAFVQQKARLPTVLDQEFFEKLPGVCSSTETASAYQNHVKNFVGSCAGKLAPVQAMFGALGAQEAIKAATGLYNPVKQILLYDCDELLAAGRDNKAATKSSNQPATSGLAHILGHEVEGKASSARIFVVGAGAIGCEVLKNLAAMGVATVSNGCIALTDMDTIERSNLSRQLLFRDSNIGDFKSVAAQAAILRMNEAIKMKVYTNKVGDEGGGAFDETFWSSGIDIVLNALDNMEARLFIDRQCVANTKPMVDAGTLGSKGNVQVVVPHQSESYGSSVDPPEPAIPVCTLKNFPYAISHTIQWARDLFDGFYQRRPRQANDLAESLASLGPSSVAKELLRDLGDTAAGEICEDLAFAGEGKKLSKARENALQWAANVAVRLFHTAIEDLLREHPPNSVDEDGEPFWTGSRKVPTPILFSPTATRDQVAQVAANDNLLEFVKSAARLRLKMLLGDSADGAVGSEEAKKALLKASAGEASEDAEDKQGTPQEAIVEHLKSIPGGSKHNLFTIEFEKDDDSNGHVQFVNAASNLRAICYGIPPTNVMETRRVAGKIVPAMITTTAVVSALSCIEFLKLLQEAPLKYHRNAFINLALPFFAFIRPVPVERVSGPCGKSYSIWDTISIQESKKKDGKTQTLTLRRFIKKLKRALGDDDATENLQLSTISAGPYMIYANFLHEDDKDMLRQSIFKLVREAMTEDDEDDFSGRAGDDDNSVVATATAGEGKRLELTVTVEDNVSGEEFELPPVLVMPAAASGNQSK